MGFSNETIELAETHAPQMFARVIETSKLPETVSKVALSIMEELFVGALAAGIDIGKSINTEKETVDETKNKKEFLFIGGPRHRQVHVESSGNQILQCEGGEYLLNYLGFEDVIFTPVYVWSSMLMPEAMEIVMESVNRFISNNDDRVFVEVIDTKGRITMRIGNKEVALPKDDLGELIDTLTEAYNRASEDDEA